MELLFNDWITARKAIKMDAEAARLYVLNLFLGIDPVFEKHDQVAAVVTVARKK